MQMKLLVTAIIIIVTPKDVDRKKYKMFDGNSDL